MVFEIEDEGKELPDWTFRGGSFRSGFSTEDIPTAWSRRSGKWKREELVPYGKASPDYRRKYFICPECKKQLTLGNEEYRFRCDDCGLEFKWSFGGLVEKIDGGRYTPEDC